MISDTIVAISTATGEGAIGIVRMSGARAFEVADLIFKPFSTNIQWTDKKMVYGQIVYDNKVIDEVLLVKMFAPRTYTCENIVEIHCHGGVVPLKTILGIILQQDVRLAARGEFTQRAFLNGRIDLAQAESVIDLIQSKTSKGFDIAIQQLDGKLSNRINIIREDIMTLMAQIEVSIDYPEEDIEEISYAKIKTVLESNLNSIDTLLKTSQSGRMIREGLKTVIIGKPNVGKSSLMNALLNESRAIVTDIPGTTRDIIEENINIAGIPIRLIDTAGIRETDDAVEKIGVEKSKRYFNEADVIIFVLNAAETLSDEDREIMSYIQDKHTIVLINKSDLPTVIDENEIRKTLHDRIIIKTSMEQLIGLDELEKAIEQIVYQNQFEMNEQEIVSNERHIALLHKAFKHVKDALEAAKTHLPYDFIEVDINDAMNALGLITGQHVDDELLSNIFGRFCLGK